MRVYEKEWVGRNNVSLIAYHLVNYRNGAVHRFISFLVAISSREERKEGEVIGCLFTDRQEESESRSWDVCVFNAVVKLDLF